MNGLSVNLKSVSSFYLVQADREESLKEAVVDEREFKDYKEALRVMEQSQAPIKYMKFIYDGDEYKLYPIEDSEDFTVIKKSIYN